MPLIDLLKLGPPVNNWRIEKVILGDNIPTWVLGTGTADTTTFLRGDLTWAVTPGGGGATNLTLANLNNLTLDITSSTGTGVTLPQATILLAGLLIASDKIKLNNLSGINTGDQDLSSVLTVGNITGGVAGGIIVTDGDLITGSLGQWGISFGTDNEVLISKGVSTALPHVYLNDLTATIGCPVLGRFFHADPVSSHTTHTLLIEIDSPIVQFDQQTGIGTEIATLSATGVLGRMAVPSAFITAISDTNSINLTVTGTTLTADILTQNTATINLSIDASGLKADLASLNISQFTNDVPYLVVGDLTGYVQDTRLINTTSPLAGGGDLSADRTITTSMTTNRLIGRTTAASGVMEELTPAGTLELASLTATANGETYEQFFRTGLTRKRYNTGIPNGHTAAGFGLTIPANRLTCAFRVFSKARVIAQEAIYVITAGTAAARATVYIYTCVNGYPSAKFHTFTEHNTSATTKKENTGLAVALPAGGYWFIIHVNEQITIPGLSANVSQHPLGVAEPDNADTTLQLYSSAYAYGAAPATFVETDFTFGTTHFPAIGLILST